MSKENHNDNLDEDLKDEDFEDEADVEDEEDEDSSDDGEEEEEEDDEKDEDEEDESDDEDDDDDEDGEDEDDEDDEDLDPSGKFKGKSKKDIIKAYRSLEKTRKGQVLEQANKIAQQLLAKKGINADKKDTKEGDDGEFDLGLSDEEISKMSPATFARHLNKMMMQKATEIAQNVIQKNQEVRQNVTREIHEATKAFPLLKENPGFRDVVITFIENAAGKGEVMTLKEACKRAQKALGIKKTEGDDKGNKDNKDGKDGEKKKKKMGMERSDGHDGKGDKDEEQKIKEGMLGNKGGSALGGLGI